MRAQNRLERRQRSRPIDEQGGEPHVIAGSRSVSNERREGDVCASARVLARAIDEARSQREISQAGRLMVGLCRRSIGKLDAAPIEHDRRFR